MQKRQPAGQRFRDENDQRQNMGPNYAYGSSAGHHGTTQQKIPDGATQQTSTGADNQRSPPQAQRDANGTRPTHAKTTVPGAHQHGQQRADPARRDPIYSNRTREGAVHEQQHEMDGQVSNPDTNVQFKASGHY